MMQEVGFFKEFGLDSDNPESIQPYISNSAQENEAEIVQYLLRGSTLLAIPGVGYDVIRPEKGIIAASHIITDGDWMWPIQLAYYIEEYHIKLPINFLTHMKSNNWKPPTLTEDDLEKINEELMSQMKDPDGANSEVSERPD